MTLKIALLIAWAQISCFQVAQCFADELSDLKTK